MHLIEQQFPFMGVLRTEQVMDAYTVSRRIEQAGENDVKNVCIRFYSLSNGKDIWISGEAFNNAGGMQDFLDEVVGLPQDKISQITKLPWEVIATRGEGLELAFIGNKFNWEVFGLVTCALEEYDADVLRAAKDCGVDYDKIGDKYVGEFESYIKFVQQYWDETNMHEVPEFCKKYIDYAKIEADWAADGDYAFSNGYVFHD